MDKNTVVVQQRIPIVIPLFNAVEYTKKAVESLKKNTHENLYEVIFVDNGSTDGTKDYLKQLVQDDPEHYRVITNEVNKGFSGGVNTGLQAISSFNWEYVCVANSDLIFTPNWLVQLVECAQTNRFDNIGMVAPVSNAAGGTQGISVNYKTEEEIHTWATSHHQLNKNNYTMEARLVGLCLLITRKLFDSIGYFDERFLGGMWEDNDYSLRARLAGFKLVCDRSTMLHHFFHKSFQGNKLNSSELFHSNKNRYYDKWSSDESIYERLAVANAKARGITDIESLRQADGRIKKFIVGACRVKDGAEHIGRMLERVSEFADEIVVLVSKLTTDNTKEICSKYPKVVLLEDDNDDGEHVEVDSRNRLLEMAYSRHPDWIWNCDHDEVPSKFLVKNVHKLTNPNNPEIMLWTFPIIQLWNTESQQRMDGVWGRFWQGRMFRALPGLKIESDKKIHCGSHPIFPAENCGTSLYKISHYGNVDPKYRKSKYDRYTQIDKEKDLNMVLGAWKDYYWRLYYGQPNQENVTAFTGHWSVIPDPKDWSLPKYGQFFDRDAYRHVYEELGARFVPYSDDTAVSLVMLVHNEGGFVSKCIESARGVVDEVICIDTGCTDTTPDLAEQLGAEVHKFQWNNNFSDARNFSLSKASGDWILRLDPDETLPPESAIQIPTMIRESNVDGYIFPIMNWLENPNEKSDAQWALSETCRLFRNRYPSIRYTGLVHEELDDSFEALKDKRKLALKAQGLSDAEIEAKNPLLDIRRSPMSIWHYGYLRGQQFLDKKFEYYCALGNAQIKADPNDVRPYFTTAVHYLHVGDYEKAINNYKKVIELEPAHHMAYNDMGVIYWMQGRLDLAEQCFRKALGCMNEHVNVYHKNRATKNLEKVKTQVLALCLF